MGAAVTASQGRVGEAGNYVFGFPARASGPASARPKLETQSARVLYARYRTGLLISDSATIAAVAAAGMLVSPPAPDTVPFALLSALVLWIALVARRTRAARVVGSGGSEYGRVVSAILFTFGLLAIAVLLANAHALKPLFFYSACADILALPAGRALWRYWFATQRVRGRHKARALLVGPEADVIALTERMEMSPAMPYTVVGLIADDAQLQSIEVGSRSIPILAGLGDIVGSVRTTRADIVIVTGHDSANAALVRQLSWSLEGTSAGLALASGLNDVADPRIHVSSVDGLPLMHVEIPTFVGGKHLIKRTFDITLSALALLVLAPVFAAIAIAVKSDSQGTVLFRQDRVGKDGRTFAMLKFRSMVPGAEQELSSLLGQNEGAGVLFKLKNDPRVTRVGSVLRKYSLDELPQIWNILIGDMSIVGPRPPLPREVSQYETHMNRRLYIKPGLTGLWQVSGRSDLSWEQSIRLDLYYVANWSLAGDVHIMWRTVKVVLNPTGAY